MGFDGPADLVEYIPGRRADCAAQVMENGRGGEVGNTGKVCILQIISGVQPAAGKDGVLDAGGEHDSKAHLQVEAVQLLQKTVLHIVGKVAQVVPINFVHGAAGLLHESPTKVRFLRGTILPLQGFRNSVVVFLPQFP